MARTVPDLPKPWAALVELAKDTFVITREWWKALDDLVRACRHHLPVSGTVTFDTDTTADVTFTTAEADTNYIVLVEAPEDQRVWISAKATTGFTINVSSTSSATFGWALIRR